VYSFGMIMYEVLTRRVPFDEYLDDPRFARDIDFQDGKSRRMPQIMALKSAIMTEGLRPTTPDTPLAPFVHLMRMCWDTTPEGRPMFDEAVAISEAVFERSQDDVEHVKRLVVDTLMRDCRRQRVDEDSRTEEWREASDQVTAKAPQLEDNTAEVCELLVDLSCCCLDSFSMACFAYLPTTGGLWVGSTNGLLAVVSEATRDVLALLRLAPSRIVDIIHSNNTVLSFLENGLVYTANAVTHTITGNFTLVSGTLSAVHISVLGQLWCVSPSANYAVMWPSLGHLGIRGFADANVAAAASSVGSSEPAGSYLRVFNKEDGSVRVDVSKKKVEKISSGRPPLLVDCISSFGDLVFLACGTVLVTLSPDLAVLRTMSFDRECGRITAVVPSSEGVLLGTYQGMLIWDGQRTFSMQTRVVCFEPLFNHMVGCFGYDGSFAVFDRKKMQPVDEQKLACENSVLVKGALIGAHLVYGVRTGQVLKQSFGTASARFSDLPKFAMLDFEDIHLHPMYSKAWGLLEFLVARACRGLLCEQLLRSSAQAGNPQDAMRALFSNAAQTHQLPFLLRILCMHYTSREIEARAGALHNALTTLPDLSTLRDVCNVCVGESGPLFSSALRGQGTVSITLRQIAEECVRRVVADVPCGPPP